LTLKWKIIFVSNFPETIFKISLLIFPWSLKDGIFIYLFFNFSTWISLGCAPSNFDTIGFDLSSFSRSFFDIWFKLISKLKLYQLNLFYNYLQLNGRAFFHKIGWNRWWRGGQDLNFLNVTHLWRFTTGNFPRNYQPTIFDN